mmetsp:Transcript_130785/g.279763  ORF Transcript_130785/g.279763 Transcript_130785/m.279763 type:complete len:81 (-) Transcript_130785:95-337(-)
MNCVRDRFDGRVRLVANDPDLLLELSPTGKWRPGAFEVVEPKSKKVLYTKLGSGLHVTEKESWMTALFDDIEATCGLSKP